MSTEEPGPGLGAERPELASLVLVGAGRMGGALLRGWLSLGVPGARIIVLEPHPDQALAELCLKHGVVLNPPAEKLASPEVLVLAVKPQALDAAVPAMARVLGPETLVLSIIAGKTAADLAARLPGARTIVRAMPNTPAAVGRGMTGVFPAGPIDDRQKRLVSGLLGAVGQVRWLAQEGLIDAVTAVSGSGPAYVFYLTECLAGAGEALGLSPELAADLARATVEGAGALMARNPELAPAILRQNVTSPGGTTAAGLEVLAGPDGLAPLVARTVAAAHGRARDLAG